MSKKYIHIDYGEAKNISSCVTNVEEDRNEMLSDANYLKNVYQVHVQQHMYANMIFDQISNDLLDSQTSYATLHSVLSLLLAQYISGECFMCLSPNLGGTLPRFTDDFNTVIHSLYVHSSRSYIIYKAVRALMPNLHTIIIKE